MIQWTLGALYRSCWCGFEPTRSAVELSQRLRTRPSPFHALSQMGRSGRMQYSMPINYRQRVRQVDATDEIENG